MLAGNRGEALQIRPGTEIVVSGGVAFQQRASGDMPVNSASTFNLPFNSAIALFLIISSIKMYS